MKKIKLYSDNGHAFNRHAFKNIKTLREEIIEMVLADLAQMEEKEGPAILNPRTLNHWAVKIKEQSKDIQLSSLGMQDYRFLNQVLELAVFCHACLEEHIGKKIDELMPAAGMEIDQAITEAKELIAKNGIKSAGGAATPPASMINHGNRK